MSSDIIDLSFRPGSDKIEVETVSSTRFVLLYILSFGLYSIWWMNNTWRFFKEKESLDIMPVWRAIFSVFFIYSLFGKILDLAKQNNPALNPYSSGLLAVLYVVLSFSSRLPDPYWLITFGACLCFIQPIEAFNSAVANSDQYRAQKDSGMTTGQIIIVVVGALFWVLVLFGLFATVPEEY
jgi:hypothetical protein